MGKTEETKQESTESSIGEQATRPDPREAARQRAAECGREIEAVLAKHRCRIAPFLLPPEHVGTDGSKMIVTASFGVIPYE